MSAPAKGKRRKPRFRWDHMVLCKRPPNTIIFERAAIGIWEVPVQGRQDFTSRLQGARPMTQPAQSSGQASPVVQKETTLRNKVQVICAGSAADRMVMNGIGWNKHSQRRRLCSASPHQPQEVPAEQRGRLPECACNADNTNSGFVRNAMGKICACCV